MSRLNWDQQWTWSRLRVRFRYVAERYPIVRSGNVRFVDGGMIRRYRVAREAYRPERVRVLLIAESPPASGGFFYFPKTIGKDHLFRETMKVVGLWTLC